MTVAAEIETLIREQQAGAQSAKLFTLGLDGHRTLCKRWAGPFEDMRDLHESVEERALRQCNTLGGIHNFCFELYDGAGNALGSEVFRLSAEALEGDRSMLSEPANEGGVLAQLMRQNEALVRTGVYERKEATVAFREVFGAMQKLVALSHGRSDHAEGKYLEAMQTFHKMITGEQQHTVELEKARGNAEAKRVLAEKVSGYIPLLLGSFVKNGPIRNAGAATAIGVKNLFESLKAEQVEGILALLTPEQQNALIAMVQAAEVAETPPGATNQSKPNGSNGARHEA